MFSIIKKMLLITRVGLINPSDFSKSAGLNSFEHLDLIEIYRLGGECGNEGLVYLTGQTGAGVSVQLKRLEEKGFLIRFQDQENYRYRRVRLTEKGLDYVEKAVVLGKEREKRLCSCLSEEERFQLCQELYCFDHNLVGEDNKDYETRVEDWPEILRNFICIFQHINQTSRDNQKNAVYERQKYVLLYLDRGGEYRNFKEIEQRLMMRQQTVQKMITKLEQMGLVEVRKHPEHPKSKQARATQAGSDQARIYRERLAEIQRQGCEGMDEERMVHLEELLDRLWNHVCLHWNESKEKSSYMKMERE